MLTLITGTPGAGKTLYAVWDYAQKVPGSTVEKDGEAVPRKLFSNIKNLLVEHEHITAQDLDTWHLWAKPGDVILFDEVQEVWRPRGLGTKVPDCIAKLETHRHMGVDLILITQHPMLVDPNIRRLVNQHIHLRRLAKTVAYIYEWDHCANPGQIKTCIQSRVWFHPKKAYTLYKSAELHTKPTARVPRIALLLLVAVAGALTLGPVAYSRIQDRLQPPSPIKAAKVEPQTHAPTPSHDQSPHREASGLPLPAVREADYSSLAGVHAAKPIGCMASPVRCVCFDAGGAMMPVADAICREASHSVGFVLPAVASYTKPDNFTAAAKPAASSPDLEAVAVPASGPAPIVQKR